MSLSQWNNKNTARRMLFNAIRGVAYTKNNTRVGNAQIMLDPKGHPVQTNQYRGFLRRWGKDLPHAVKKAILTRSSALKNSPPGTRYPPKRTRVTSNLTEKEPQVILAKAFFGRRAIPVKYIGGGVNGKVYATQNSNRVIKFILGSEPQEFVALKKLQSTGVAPSFRPGNGRVLKLTPRLKNAAFEMFGHNYSNETHMTALIMGKVGGANPMTLQRYVNTHPGANKADITRRIRHILDQMGFKGISHGNFHSENIIVQVGPTGKIVRMWVIDFGRAISIPLKKLSTILLKKPSGRTFGAGMLYNKTKELHIPLVGPNRRHRIDPYMAHTLGVKYLEPNLERVRNLRKFVHKEAAKLPKTARRVTTPARRAKSATPARRPTSASPRRANR
jgi:hypothetical protein